jgi:hypothetical protein
MTGALVLEIAKKLKNIWIAGVPGIEIFVQVFDQNRVN